MVIKSSPICCLSSITNNVTSLSIIQLIDGFGRTKNSVPAQFICMHGNAVLILMDLFGLMKYLIGISLLRRGRRWVRFLRRRLLLRNTRRASWFQPWLARRPWPWFWTAGNSGISPRPVSVWVRTIVWSLSAVILMTPSQARISSLVSFGFASVYVFALVLWIAPNVISLCQADYCHHQCDYVVANVKCGTTKLKILALRCLLLTICFLCHPLLPPQKIILHR